MSGFDSKLLPSKDSFKDVSAKEVFALEFLLSIGIVDVASAAEVQAWLCSTHPTSMWTLGSWPL